MGTSIRGTSMEVITHWLIGGLFTIDHFCLAKICAVGSDAEARGARNGRDEQRGISLNRADMALICRDASGSTGSPLVPDLWHSREWLRIPRCTTTHCFGEQIQ